MPVQMIHSCGAAVVYASIPGKPRARVCLDGYPDPRGKVRVDVLGCGRLVVLAAGDPSSKRTKRYDRHDCGAEPGPRQMTLDGA